VSYFGLIDRHIGESVRGQVQEAGREQGQYELHASAKKILRISLGPEPDDPEYQ